MAKSFLSQSVYLFFAGSWIISHSLCYQLALGIELLPLKHDSLLHLYFPVPPIWRLGNPALLLFIVGHKWMVEYFRKRLYNIQLQYKCHEESRTEATVIKQHQCYSATTRLRTSMAPICGCQSQETCYSFDRIEKQAFKNRSVETDGGGSELLRLCEPADSQTHTSALVWKCSWVLGYMGYIWETRREKTANTVCIYSFDHFNKANTPYPEHQEIT